MDEARCIHHPEEAADFHCPRCGSFVCIDCLPDSCPWICIPCRSQLKLSTESVFLRCLGCEGSMEPGYILPVSPLGFYSMEGFINYVNWPQSLVSHGLSVRQKLKMFVEELTTWSNSWFRIDRCSRCCHALIDTSRYFFTKEIKARRSAGEPAHETPWKSDGHCPQCEGRLMVGYLVRTFPTSYRAYEDFDRFFLWGYKTMIRDGIPMTERILDQLKFKRSYFHPMSRCEPCGYAVLQYRVFKRRIDIKGHAEQAERYRKRLLSDAS